MKSATCAAAAIVALAWALFAPIADAEAEDAPDPSTCVDLTGDLQGRICGLLDERAGVRRYLGIRFAEADRWRPPQLVRGYGIEPLSATAFGPRCAQMTETGPDGVEDCLNLNVYAPVDAEGAPVLLFVYGGAFVSGSNRDLLTGPGGGAPLYDGTAFARDHGVVLVTVNYRLGAFGFLPIHVGDDGRQHVTASNLGLRDQLAGLAWVRETIAAFGGDPERIALFGESAGAMSVGIHVLGAAAPPPGVVAAIMDSNLFGYPYPDLPLGAPAQPADAPNRKPQSLIELAGLFFGCLEAVMAREADCRTPKPTAPDGASTRQILLAQTLYQERFGEDYVQLSETFEQMSLGPLLDGSQAPQHGLAPLLVRQPAETLRAGAPIPLLLGFNGNEGLLFVESLMNITPPVVTPELYAQGVRAVFPDAAAETLASERYAVTATPKYGLEGQTLVDKTHGGPLTALTDMIGDLAFACGILAARGDGPAPVWVYRFVEPAVTQAAPGTPLCDPGNRWGNVCHGAELPYTFDSLPKTDEGRAAAGAARFVNGAWAAFAADPLGTGPGAGFARYEAGTQIVNRIADGGVRPEAGADQRGTAYCDSLWDARLPGAGD